MKSTQKPISATALGQHVFCPNATRLSLLGTQVSQEARRRMDEGNRAHDRWQQRQDMPAPQGNIIIKLLIVVMTLLALAIYLAVKG